MEIFPEINKRVVPNKHVGKKLWTETNGNQKQISYLTLHFNIFLGDYHNVNKKKTHKTVKKLIFCSFLMLIGLNKDIGRNNS